MDNGGILDRVHFVSKTRHEEDAEYLRTIISSNPERYTFRDYGSMEHFGDYTGLWDNDIDPDTIYVKIGSPLRSLNFCGLALIERRRYRVYFKERNS